MRFTIGCSILFTLQNDESDILTPLSYGDDSTPLISRVPEQPPSHWGKVTSKKSAAYTKFLADARAKQIRKEANK
jgi:hypothetical protein